MGALFRSEEMALCQIIIQREAAYVCVDELGELGLAQFLDLNADASAFQHKFVNEVRRCDEMERQLLFLQKEIKKENIPITDTGANPEAAQPAEMIALEEVFEKLENDLREVNENSKALAQNLSELTELKLLLRKIPTFFDEAEAVFAAESIKKKVQPGEQLALCDEQENEEQYFKLGLFAGVVLCERLPAFERMLWRVCRNNMLLCREEIFSTLRDPVTDERVYKSAFVIVFQGDELRSRVEKICQGFRAVLYPCSETSTRRREMATSVMIRIQDLKTILDQTKYHRLRLLVAAARNIEIWAVKLRKMKAIYHTLNLFNLDVTQKCLIAECWIAVADLHKIGSALRRATERSGCSVPPILSRMTSPLVPPTYNRTNKFTSAFQRIVDAYGVAKYREVNPAPFTIITFPFFFSLMFGDAGHGFLLMLFGLWMCLKARHLAAQKIRSEIWTICFSGRYVLLLMGMFSVYAGLIYNDVFSKSLNIFGSSYKVNLMTEELQQSGHEMLVPDPANEQCAQVPYPFGFDPIWQLSENKIPYMNSFKMKISIIFGVSHMTFGVVLSTWNHRYFKNPSLIWVEFLPQILFLVFLFDYLCFLMFLKWIQCYTASPGCAPSLLITFIGMMIFKYNEDGKTSTGCGWMFTGQEPLQKALLLLSLSAVPAILLGKLIFSFSVFNEVLQPYAIENNLIYRVSL